MAKLTEAEMIARYDAERAGTLYTKPTAICPACACPLAPGANFCDSCGAASIKPEPSTLLLTVADYIDDDVDRCCPNGTPERDCPACTARYEAERVSVHARAAAAPTARERANILLSNHEMPDGDQIFDLLLEDHIVSYAWSRCVDWVLWRQSHGKPVKRLGDADDTPAAIDARYDAARAFAANLTNYSPSSSDRDVALACAGEMIQDWERTPEEVAKIRRDNDLMIQIFETIEAHFERKRSAHTAPLAG